MALPLGACLCPHSLFPCWLRAALLLTGSMWKDLVSHPQLLGIGTLTWIWGEGDTLGPVPQTRGGSLHQTVCGVGVCPASFFIFSVSVCTSLTRIFTAIMPMVAAGLLLDDPTLQPVRRLVSLVGTVCVWGSVCAVPSQCCCGSRWGRPGSFGLSSCMATACVLASEAGAEWDFTVLDLHELRFSALSPIILFVSSVSVLKTTLPMIQ